MICGIFYAEHWIQIEYRLNNIISNKLPRRTIWHRAGQIVLFITLAYARNYETLKLFNPEIKFKGLVLISEFPNFRVSLRDFQIQAWRLSIKS